MIAGDLPRKQKIAATKMLSNAMTKENTNNYNQEVAMAIKRVLQINR
jgi:hypothetical protein